MNWDLLKKIANYYEARGGKLSKEAHEFLLAQRADYFSDECRAIGEERCIPLLSYFLQHGIEKDDFEYIQDTFDMLVALTGDKPLGQINFKKFKPSRTLKKYLLEGKGGKDLMAKDYDNKWYLESIDNVLEGITVTIAYLQSIKGGFSTENKRADVDLVLGKYEDLKRRVEALRNAPPEAQCEIAQHLREVERAIVEEQEKNLRFKQIYPSAHVTDDKNVFVKTEQNMKAAESAIGNLTKKKKKPSSEDIQSAYIGKRNYTAIKQLSNVREYREQCRAMIDTIDEELKKKRDSIGEMSAVPDELQEELNKAVAERQALEAKKREVWTKYQNGLMSKQQLDLEGNTMKSQQKMMDQKIATLQKLASIASPAQYVMQMTELYEMQSATWLSIKMPFLLILNNPSEDRRVIKHFEKLIESMTAFTMYITGDAGKNGQVDMGVIRNSLQTLAGEMQNELRMVQKIVELQKPTAVEPLGGTTEEQSTEDFFQTLDPTYATGDTLSPTEMLRPDGGTASSPLDPYASLIGDDDPKPAGTNPAPLIGNNDPNDDDDD